MTKPSKQARVGGRCPSAWIPIQNPSTNVNSKVLAFGKSGGLTRTLYTVAAGERTPLALSLSSGQAADGPVGRALLRALGPVSGRPALLVDRAYEGDRTRHLAAELGYEPVVPSNSNRRRTWTYDAQRYLRRNEIEHLFGRFKRFRRIATHYDKLDVIFLSGIYLALIYDLLPSL